MGTHHELEGTLFANLGRWSSIAEDPQYVIHLAADEKRKKYEERLKTKDTNFLPFCLDVYGQIHNDAYLFLSRVTTLIARNKGYSYKDTKNYLLDEMQVTLARAVSQSLGLRGA